MNPLQTAIARIFRIPTEENGRQRSYAGARRDGASVSGWTTTSGSADSEIWGALSVLRQRAWDLYRNDPNVCGAINDIVSETVGQGILLQSRVTKRRGQGLDIKINHNIEEAFHRWADNPKWCDVAGKMTFWKMQKTVLLSVLVSGEVLVRFVRQKFDDSPLPFALEVIEADQLDDQYTVQNAGNGNYIRMGVEVNKWGRPVAYWVRPHHPGDVWQGQQNTAERIPAKDILHIWNWRGYRPGQTRGISALHSIILQSKNLLGYQESEIVKARIQSCIGAFFENEVSDELGLPQDDDGFFYRQFEPGMMEDLPPGKKLVPFDPSSPNPNLPDFVKTMQRSLARGLNTSSYLVSGDLADANYSSMRVGLLQQRKQFEILRDDLNEDFNHKVFCNFLPQAVLANYIALPPDWEYNCGHYQKDFWVGESWDWVDPVKDVRAHQIELEMGSTSLTNILAQKGIDIEEHFATLAAEKELRQKYGIAEEEPEPEPEPTANPAPKEPEESTATEEEQSTVPEATPAPSRSYPPLEPEPIAVIEPEPEPLATAEIEPAPIDPPTMATTALDDVPPLTIDDESPPPAPDPEPEPEPPKRLPRKLKKQRQRINQELGRSPAPEQNHDSEPSHQPD